MEWKCAGRLGVGLEISRNTSRFFFKGNINNGWVCTHQSGLSIIIMGRGY